MQLADHRRCAGRIGLHDFDVEDSGTLVAQALSRISARVVVYHFRMNAFPY